MICQRFIIALAIAVSAFSAYSRDYVQYVNTMVGTANSVTKAAGLYGKGTEEMGQTLPAVLSPRGMNFWTPQTRDTELKCIAPYYYADTLLQGFRNSHWIVGGCTQDYGSATLMPIAGNLRCQPEDRATPFSHANEVSTPYYYKVNLPEEQLTAEMTGTSRCALFRITPSASGKVYIVINPNSDEGQGNVLIDTLHRRVIVTNPIHRIYQGKGQPAGHAGYYVAQFDRPFSAYGCYDSHCVKARADTIGNNPEIGCYIEFDLLQTEELLVKAASSFVSADGALLNMQAEMPSWNFDAAKDALKDQWNAHLGKIEVESDNVTELRKFYTALYHASFLPHAINDVDGAYPAFSRGEVMHLAENETAYYDDFSLWDTYRALHPLLCILSPAESGEMMQSLVKKYEQGGWMPIFPCWNSYTAAMIGDHVASVVADACAKGVLNFDVETAYKGLRQNAFDIPATEDYINGKGRRALSSYLQYGYIPLEDSVPDAYHKKEQASRTLEYAYDDFCLAQIARLLGKTADYAELMLRSRNYTHAINPRTGYADGRYASGKYADDAPFEFTKHITEGAPCHYTWYVPHHPQGLIRIIGGKRNFEAKLDSMFSQRRYWHGNEPCHQIAFMYDCVGRQQKAAKEVRHIMDTEYLDVPGGLSGNDDAGQMSAWYVFAALGFYPVCPGTDEYYISCPTFKKATIHLDNGSDVILSAPQASPAHTRIKSIKHNGKKHKGTKLRHSQLMQGGEWTFSLTQ